jgi:hypothetical protein
MEYAGSYCGTTGLTAPSGPCTGGFYCIGGAKLPNPVAQSYGDIWSEDECLCLSSEPDGHLAAALPAFSAHRGRTTRRRVAWGHINPTLGRVALRPAFLARLATFATPQLLPLPQLSVLVSATFKLLRYVLKFSLGPWACSRVLL